MDFSNFESFSPHRKGVQYPTFHIKKYGIGYKLVFCRTESAQACLNIERFDAYNGEEGRRLTLTEEEYGASDIVFIRAYDDDDDKVIKSVV